MILTTSVNQGSLNRHSTVVDLGRLQNYEIHIQYLSMFHTLQNSSQCMGQFPEKDSIFYHNAVSAVFLFKSVRRE